MGPLDSRRSRHTADRAGFHDHRRGSRSAAGDGRTMRTDGQVTPDESEARASFPTTHWSMVLHAGGDSESQAHAALETLCRAYWYPLYAFVRRQGRAHHEAQDGTQEFLARQLAAGGIAEAR